MTQKRSGSRIETFTHRKTGRSADVRLEKRSGLFFAEIPVGPGIPPDTTESRDVREVRNWLEEKLATTTNDFVLDWQPVVEVAHSDGDRGWSRRETNDAGVRVYFERYWIALTPDQTEWRKLAWEHGDEEHSGYLEPEHRYAASERYRPGPEGERRTEREWRRGFKEADKVFKIPFFEPNPGGDPRSYLPYTPALWAGLEGILAAIKDARAGVAKLIGTKAGLAVLNEIGSGKATLQLTSGEPPKKKRGARG